MRRMGIMMESLECMPRGGDLWRKAATLTTNDLVRMIIDVDQESVELNFNLYDHKFKLEEQMGLIISRLDDMEDKLRARFPEFEKKN